ncbi:Uncharacterized protein APZ42_022420 [Daphnia magna]|uniref:Uncharacterized protein n=1 Tax=Daphnia magna TaxID=35525 RepID=A0A164VHT8_9CRUS|nr:Uncharacterized protein APZ42_022420 [Daphnia magna]
MTDRHCSVSINAYMTLPRLGQMVPSAANNHQPNGIRFECSWSNSLQDLSPTPNRRATSTSRLYNASSETDSSGFRLSPRKNSSSGYGSGETTAPVMAATLTVSHPAGSSGSASAEGGRRWTQPYERRCRSTCSITLQTGQENGVVHPTQSVANAPTGGYPLHPHHFRRCSEGETWNSHTKMPQLSVPPAAQSPCPVPTARPVSPAISATSIDKVKRRKDGRKHGRERPRTVHIDVYCTASESETETCRESDESNESNTSTGQTVLRADQIGTRVRHVRKKNSLPHGLAAKNGSGPALKPVLSYRISTKELAEAVERKRRSSKTTDVSDLLDDELFRDLTLTDSSVRSLLADSEPESSDTRFSEDSILDAQEADRTWRSPEKERKRKMLEQRKQQWRAAKSAEALEQVGRLACRDISMRPTSSVDTTLHSAAYELREKFQRQLRGIQAGSERVSRCNSQRCPTLNQTPPPPLSRESSSAASVPSSCRHSLAVTTPSLCSSPAGSCSVTDSCSSMDVPVAQCEPPKFELPWQWRVQQPASPLKSPVGMSPSNWTLKKFGRHVGPARNPDCTCAHCIDHFNRVGPFKKSGIIAS